MCCILLVTGVQLLFAYPKNHVEFAPGFMQLFMVQASALCDMNMQAKPGKNDSLIRCVLCVSLNKNSYSHLLLYHALIHCVVCKSFQLCVVNGIPAYKLLLLFGVMPPYN